ncbi:MAG: DUF5689 domain-containing protein [Bacteroidales bacterium]
MKKITLLSLFLFIGIFIMVSQGFAENNKSTKEAVEVANLGELRAQEMGENVYTVTGEVVITHIHGQRNQKYIQDDTGAIVVDDPDGIITTEYNLYDGITGISGTLSAYQNLLQFSPAEDPGAATSSDNEIEPLVITLNDIQPEHQAMLIRVNELEFVGEYTTFDPSTNYNIEDPSGTGTLRTPSQSAGLDYFGTDVPEGANDMVALVSQFGDDMQIFPRSLEDIYLDGVPAFDVTFSVIDEEDVVITDAVITFDGTTYEAGEYFFEDVFAGIYNYTAEKTGYYTRTGQVTVSGEDVTVTVVLVAESADAVNVFPWEEGFEAEAFPPDTWNHYALGAGGWASTTTANSGDIAANHNFTTGEADSWLVTPQIQLPEDAGMLLKFFQRNNFMGDYGYSAVMISTGSGNPEHGEFFEVYEASAAINNYTERILSLGDFAGQVIYVAFAYQGDNAHQWFIDDVSIEEAPEAIIVNNLEELRDQDAGDLTYIINGEVVITHMHGQRNQKYIQDATGAIVIDDPDGIIETEYSLYDGVTGLEGKLSAYNNLLQFVPVEDPGAATSTGNVIEPMLVTLNDLTPDHQSMLVIVADVEFDTDATEFAPSTSYNIFDPSGESILRTPSQSAELDYFGTSVPTGAINMIALVSQFGDDMQIFPRSLADIDVELSTADIIDLEHIKVYPNPFNNYIYIEGAENYNQIVIFNNLGQVIQSFDNPSQSHIINTSELKQGIYFIRFMGDNGKQHVTKIIKR